MTFFNYWDYLDPMPLERTRYPIDLLHTRGLRLNGPPDEAISELVVNLEDFDVDYSDCVDSFLEAFTIWRARHNTGQSLIAIGGRFLHGSLDEAWDGSIICLWNVPVAKSLKGRSTNVYDFENEMRLHPPYAFIAGRRIRISSWFRVFCKNCRETAPTVHETAHCPLSTVGASSSSGNIISTARFQAPYVTISSATVTP